MIPIHFGSEERRVTLPRSASPHFHTVRRMIVYTPDRGDGRPVAGGAQHLLSDGVEVFLPSIRIGKVIDGLLEFFFNPSLTLGYLPGGLRRRKPGKKWVIYRVAAKIDPVRLHEADLVPG